MRVIPMSEMSEHKGQRRVLKNMNSFCGDVIQFLRRGESDYVFYGWQIDQLSEMLKPRELLVVTQGDGFFLIKLASKYEILGHYDTWVNNGNRGTLQDYLKEVRAIWSANS
jgi:uncharacterized membrane-anchored protein